MSEAKDPEPEYDLLDVVGGGIEKCARTIFGQPGELSPAVSKSLNDKCGGHLQGKEEVVENRGDAEDERSEAPVVLPPSLSIATMKMPDIGGQIENMTAKVLAVGNCQGLNGRELPYLKSLWTLGDTDNAATQRTSSKNKFTDSKDSDPQDDASVDSDLSFTSSVDCCALLDTRARDFDRGMVWDDSDIDNESNESEGDDDVPYDNAPPTAAASDLFLGVATTIDTFKGTGKPNALIIESPTFPAADITSHGPEIPSEKEASIHAAPSNDSDGLSNRSIVTIRCYSNEKDVVDELFVRRGHRVSDNYTERLVLSLPSNHQLVPTPFPIVFEKSEGTLQELLTEISQAHQASCSEAKLKKINERRRQVFMQIALCLDHFHEKGLVHSNLSPENIGLFEDGWKLTSIGGSTPIFTSIGGKVRGYVPPEAIERFKPDTVESRLGDAGEPGVATSEGKPTKPLVPRRQVGRKWGVLFSLRDLGLQKSTCMSADIADSFAQHNQPSILQTKKLSQEWNYRIRSDIAASPTFDIFAFGLIFVQSYLASDSLLPTTYETSNEYMAKAYSFNIEQLKGIKKEMEAVGGKEAANLAAMALQPSPLKRAQTISEILEHDYFTNDSTD